MVPQKGFTLIFTFGLELGQSGLKVTNWFVLTSQTQKYLLLKEKHLGSSKYI